MFNVVSLKKAFIVKSSIDVKLSFTFFYQYVVNVLSRAELH